MKKTGGTLYYFTLSMTAIYALLGIYIMATDTIERFFPGKKYIFGILLILYSFYRAYRIYRLNERMNSEE
jgi:hypothetical protein